MQYITEEDVSKNLTMSETIKILEEAFNECGHGRAYYKPRERITYIGGVFNTMPGIIEKFHVAGLKTYIATRSGTRSRFTFLQNSQKPWRIFQRGNMLNILCMEWRRVLGYTFTGFRLLVQAGHLQLSSRMKMTP